MEVAGGRVEGCRVCGIGYRISSNCRGSCVSEGRGWHSPVGLVCWGMVLILKRFENLSHTPAAGSVPDRDNFTTEDLLEKRNIRQVVLCTSCFRPCAAAEGLVRQKLLRLAYQEQTGLSSLVSACLLPTPGLTQFSYIGVGDTMHHESRAAELLY